MGPADGLGKVKGRGRSHLRPQLGVIDCRENR